MDQTNATNSHAAIAHAPAKNAKARSMFPLDTASDASTAIPAEIHISNIGASLAEAIR